MERRYLVATLALVATFVVFSREFSTGYMAKIPSSRAALMAELTCAKRYAAEQLIARLEPLVDRAAPEQAQMVAELNLPEVVRVGQSDTQAQTVLTQKAAEQQCAAAMKAQRDAYRAQERGRERSIEIRVRAADHAQQLEDLAVMRAEELSQRATERAQQINLAAVIRAQELAAQSMERAQCAMERSRAKMNRTQVHAMPIHISFPVPATPKIDIRVPEIPQPPTSF
jgi:hypothetical protein